MPDFLEVLVWLAGIGAAVGMSQLWTMGSFLPVQLPMVV
jgi:hypothetical protein